MSTPLQRQLAVLASLNGRAVAPASAHFAAQGTRPPAADHRKSRFAALYPAAEPLDFEGSRCWRVRAWAPLTGAFTRQGYACAVDSCGGWPTPASLARLAHEPAWAQLDTARIVFLDTETTSLAGGSGTYTFLIGLGRYAPPDAEHAEPGFVVEQYFMEDYDGEAALVAAVDDALAHAQALVSYNGRAFDVPLLATRWHMQLRHPRFPAAHLDLLHLARKFWKLRLPGCGLGEVETHILGHRRLSDVDGSWVPRIYFDFVHGIRCERIVPVFDHHAQDIFSLAALLALFCRALEQPAHPLHQDASDQWGLARLYAARGEHAHALACHEHAILLARDEELAFRLTLRLARAYRRAGRVDEAVALWHARVPQAGPGCIEPLLELAKHAEHALRDYSAAEAWVKRALEMLEGLPDATPARQVVELEKRLARLARKKISATPKTGRDA